MSRGDGLPGTFRSPQIPQSYNHFHLRRFGQRALQTCAPCTSASDYSLFIFASAILEYVRTAAVLLLLTSSANGRDRWRGYLLGVLVCTALAEGYVVVSASAAPLPRDGMAVFMVSTVALISKENNQLV
jgi:hypothetical protein